MSEAHEGAADEGENLDIGGAVRALKQGKRVGRRGWNSDQQWLSLTPSRKVAAENFWSVPNQRYARDQGDGQAIVGSYITIKTVQGTIVPWTPSITDTLATDWHTLEDSQMSVINDDETTTPISTTDAPAWQERVRAEQRELQDRVIKLDQFLSKPEYEKLPSIDQRLLRRQLMHMRDYLRTLNSRIARFTEGA